MTHNYEGSGEVQKWADPAMFKAEAQTNWIPELGVVPKVYLLWMTPDPLGSIAAFSAMYEGRVVRNLGDLTNEDRESYWHDAINSQFKAPLETVKLHFLFEGVDRSFTHQHVRQRTAVYAQESLRFAVIDDLEHGVSLPPSLMGTMPLEQWEEEATELVPDNYSGDASKAHRWRLKYDAHMRATSRLYSELVDDGMPAEDARSILPQATATRIMYVTDLSNLLYHAGNRLCTQAQFHWRTVFTQIVKEIADYGYRIESGPVKNAWQFQKIAGESVFKPACYALGRCPFKASFDRGCTIRQRVDDYGGQGIPSKDWGDETSVPVPIRTEEWLMDPTSARRH